MNDKENNNKIRKVFLDELPKSKSGKTINWKMTVGYIIHFIYNDIEGDLEVLNYKSSYLTIKYKNNTKIMRSSSLINCQLGELLGEITSEFKIEIGSRFQDDKRDITVVDRKFVTDNKGLKRKYYKYICNKDKYEGWVLEFSLLKGIGCPVCSNLVIKKGINDISTTHPHLIKYFKNIEDTYTHSCCSRKNVWVKCPNCGCEKEMKISNLYTYGISCKKCGDKTSFPNKFMFNILEQLNINFMAEYNPEWISPKRYDFYIPSMNLIIEMDGGIGHGNDNNLSNQTAEESKAIDDYKDEQARLHGIEVIRIDCNYNNNGDRFEYIKQNILNNNKLIDLFDLNKINWNKVDEFACSSLVKIACDLWNIFFDATKISEIMKIHRNTILKYLKLGATKFNWCNYNPKEIQNKAHSKAGKLSGKKVEIFKEGISLGVFPSCMELERQSEKLFGVKLGFSMIAKVCNSKRKQYKGFVFKYI